MSITSTTITIQLRNYPVCRKEDGKEGKNEGSGTRDEGRGTRVRVKRRQPAKCLFVMRYQYSLFQLPSSLATRPSPLSVFHT